MFVDDGCVPATEVYTLLVSIQSAGKGSIFLQHRDNDTEQIDKLARLAVSQFLAGRDDEALTLVDSACRMPITSEHTEALASCGFVVGQIYYDRGEPDTAILALENILALAEQAGHRGVLVCTRAHLGYIYGMLGALDYGVSLAHEAVARSHEQFSEFLPWTQAMLARLYILKGELEEAQACQVQPYTPVMGDTRPASLIAAYLMTLAAGELAMAHRDYQHAVVIMDDLLAYNKRVAASAFCADALYIKAQAFVALNDVTEANTLLEQASVEADRCGNQRMRWPVLIALSQIKAGNGNRREAEHLHAEACDIIHSVSQRAGRLKLRSAFLAQLLSCDS